MVGSARLLVLALAIAPGAGCYDLSGLERPSIDVNDLAGARSDLAQDLAPAPPDLAFRGIFAPPISLESLGGRIEGIAIGNVDGTDEIPDLVLAVPLDASGMWVLRGDGSLATGGSGFPKGLRKFITAADVGDPRDVAIADFNGDGRTDIAAADFASGNSLRVGLGLGDGRNFDFKAVAPQQTDLRRLVAGILSPGERPSVALTTAGQVLLYQDDGTGSLRFVESYDAGIGLFGIALGDFDGDGTKDIAVAQGLDGTVGVLLHRDIALSKQDGGPNGRPIYSGATTYASGAGARWIATGQFNSGDSLDDLAVANQQADTVSILLSLGGGAFPATPSFSIAVPSAPVAVAAADLDGDGVVDLAVVSTRADNASGRVSWLKGDGRGSFALQESIDVSANPWTIALGDLDGDHRIDIVVGSQGNPVGNGRVDIILNRQEAGRE